METMKNICCSFKCIFTKKPYRCIKKKPPDHLIALTFTIMKYFEELVKTHICTFPLQFAG